MNKRILIIKGSPRKRGNTSAMADAFARGASESKNIITEIILKDKTIGYCMGCGACQRNDGVCVQKYDMVLPEDRRNKTVRFTEEGMAYAEKIMGRVHESEDAAMGKLTQEQRNTLLELTRIYILSCKEAMKNG